VTPPRPDPFKRSLDAVLAELTRPIEIDPDQPTRVAVRVTAVESESNSVRPWTLPSCPELVSADFVTHAEASRPALVPIQDPASRPTPRLPGRAFAVMAGALVLFLSLAVWITSAIRH
jgi:hypothetical protein